MACPVVRKIKEFGSYGELLREVELPREVVNPLHAVQLLSGGGFVVCHGLPGDGVNRVCMVNSDGGQLVHSHGGHRGSEAGQYNGPVQLAVDKEAVYVIDHINRRVALLSATLEFTRHVVSANKFHGLPSRLCLDTQRRRLYVADNEIQEGKWIAGQVVVFSV